MTLSPKSTNWPENHYGLRGVRRLTRSAADQPNAGSSLDFGFLELDVLARDRIIFAEAHFLGLVAWVLLGHIVETRTSRGEQFDFLSNGLGHEMNPEDLRPL